MNETKIKGMLLGAVIGDTLGTPIDGLSRAHIRSVFKKIENYTDAGPALKGRLQEWKKSGLYSSPSQLMMLLSMFITLNKNFSVNEFIKFINESPETAGSDYGIFRHPAPMLRHFIQTIKSGHNSVKDEKYTNSGTDLSPVLIPMAVLNSSNTNSYIINVVSFATVFTKDIHAVSGALITNILLKKLLKENSCTLENIVQNAIDTANSVSLQLELLTAEIFSLGLNPDYLLSSVKDYQYILSDLNNIKNMDEAETKIINLLNTKIKTPVTRATVNHPMAIIPFAIYFTGFYFNRISNIFYRSAEYGGSASILCSLAGALCGAAAGCEWIPENLLNELINKKRIMNIVDSLSKGKISNEIVQDFLRCEISLTAKEIQEKDSKLKHVKIKKKKTKSRLEIERQMSNHVVESWTKLDKAKWKKKTHKDYLYNGDPAK